MRAYIWKRGLWIALVFAMTLSCSVSAESAALPEFISSGLNAYERGGVVAMMRFWLRDSPIEGSDQVLSQQNIIKEAEEFYGEYDTSQIIHIRELTTKTLIIYLAINYKRGPLFGRLVVFKTTHEHLRHVKSDWVLTEIEFNETIEGFLRHLHWLNQPFGK